MKLECMSEEQKKYMLFLDLYYLRDSDKMFEKYEELGAKYDFDEKVSFKVCLLSLVCNAYDERCELVRDVKGLVDMQRHYENILLGTKKLALELKLENSLELSNLFTYLLWGGYFSSNNFLRFQSNGRALIDEHYAFDIMNGIGVCLNFSDMLTDFINLFDYSSATVINSLGKENKSNYVPVIKRNVAKNSDSFGRNLVVSMMNPVLKNVGNHAFNLINENGKCYIYDATNLMIFDIIDKFNCKDVCAAGSAKIKPYFSHIFNDSFKSFNALVDFNVKTDFVSPYTRKDFIFTWEECCDNFLKNKYLLGCFHDEIIEDINYINSNILDVKDFIKEKRKSRKLNRE